MADDTARLSGEAQNVIDRVLAGTLRPEDYDVLPVEMKVGVTAEIAQWGAEALAVLNNKIAVGEGLPRSQRRAARSDVKRLKAARAKLAGALVHLQVN